MKAQTLSVKILLTVQDGWLSVQLRAPTRWVLALLAALAAAAGSPTLLAFLQQLGR